MLNQEHREFLKSEHGRKWIIEKTLEVVPKDKNWQNFHTPYDLCEKMISKTDVKDKSILVLFNIEFLEVLTHKFGVLNKDILFLADCRLESEMASKIYKVNNIIVNDIDNIQEVLKTLKHFDLCFSNPPYGTGSQHYDLKMINEVSKICNEIVFIHPSKWLLNIKTKEIISQNIKNLIKNKVRSFEIISSDIFNTGQIDPCVISHIDMSYSGNIIYKLFDNECYEVEDINDITIFGKDWEKIKVFKIILDEYIEKNTNIDRTINHGKSRVYVHWNNKVTKSNINDIPEDKFFCQFNAMKPTNFNNTISYKIIGYNEDKAVEKSTLNISNNIAYFFDTLNELSNFINYLKTDFCRFCLVLGKTNEGLFDGALEFIPVVNFKDSWTDEKLYKFFNISKEIITYITDFFPDDLYGLRNKS